MAEKKLISLVFCICLMFLAVTGLHSYPAKGETQKNVVRVGFPVQQGMAEKGEGNTYTGYTVDYLNELNKYTDWELEFVEVSGSVDAQMEKLKKMLDQGEIDLLGALEYDETLADRFLFPSYSYATANTSICVRATDRRWIADDFKNWNGIRIAAEKEDKDRIQELKKYASVSGFTYELVECGSISEFYACLEEGRADALLGTDLSVMADMRCIARFSPTAYYLVVTKEKPELLQKLNASLSSLRQAYPMIQAELHDKYFSDTASFYISKEDKAWIKSLDPVKVLIFDGNAPLQYMSGGIPRGVCISFFQMLQEATGLKYQVVTAKSYQDGLQKLQEGEADMVGLIPGEALPVSDMGLRLSYPYFESHKMMVMGSEAADRDNAQILSANVQDALKTIRREPDQAMLLDAYCVSYYLRKNHLYDNLVRDFGFSLPLMYSVGFTDAVDSRLAEIVNAFAGSLSSEDKQVMLYNNSYENKRDTLAERLYENRLYILAFFLVSCLAAAAGEVWLKNKKKNETMEKIRLQNNRLQKLSQILDECLFEYSYEKDRLILQNNQILFPGQHVIENFLKEPGYVISNEIEQKAADTLREVLLSREREKEVTMVLDGMECWYCIKMGMVDEDYVIGRIVDVSKAAIERRELRKRASTDSLTGLLNRFAFLQYVNAYLQNGSGEGVFLLMDLDNFKNVNDHMGHNQGDQLLKSFASYLQKHLRSSDVKTRLGGDEFSVFLPGRIEEKDLAAKLAAVANGLNKEVFAAYGDQKVSVSIGAAYIREGTESAEDLYREADDAMYVAKNGGKNSFFISDGTACMRRSCIRCRKNCRKREYLEKKMMSQET